MDVAKSKVMRSVRDGIAVEINIVIDGQVLEEMKLLNYLGSLVMSVGDFEADVQQTALEGSTVLEAVRAF